MKHFICIYIVLFFFIVPCFASHNRAGEITYKYKGGYTYEITLITYTVPPATPNQVDRPELTIFFGDGSDSAIVKRGDANGNFKNGQILTPGIQKNTYITTHTYSGPSPGNKPYKIHMEDLNRVGDVVNMFDSFNTPFYIETDLYIIPLLIGKNDSPILLNPPLDDACVGRCFYHNPGAHDPDGDSLSYDLVPCLGAGGNPVDGFSIPYPGPNGETVLNPVTGDFRWCAPQKLKGVKQDEYNIAIRITEWRKLSGSWYRIGTVLRDMQITVRNCTNEPPRLVNVRDTCIEAGKELLSIISATDSPGELLLLSASGGPFISKPPATFTADAFPKPTPIAGTFSWKTNCDLIRKQPYTAIFKVKDNGKDDAGKDLSLVDIKSMFITIVAPATRIISAAPKCNEITLNWETAPCNSTLNPVAGYYIYRKNECDNWKPQPCDKGMPQAAGYDLVAIVPGYNATTFLDNNKGAGLTHGVNYAYRIVIYYLDGSLSYASKPFCTKLRNDVPLITNVDVLTTNATTGAVKIKWIKPIASPQDLDTNAFKGPYKYILYKSEGFTGAATPFISFTSSTFAGLTEVETQDNNLNTDNTPYNYRIDFFANDILVCKTKDASSVFLSITPDDKKLTLSWQAVTPWNNYLFYIYKENPAQSGNWLLKDSTSAFTYVDDSLINGSTYCYKIKAMGRYSDTAVIHPLINWSEEKCAIPVDRTPPCKLALAIKADCQAGLVQLSWNNPNLTCSKDAQYYKLFFASNKGKEMELIKKIDDINITVFSNDTLKSIAGCYTIAAVDSAGNQGPLSEQVCADNCPDYNLPNVFTPNGDGKNDFFTPIPKYHFVKDIDIKIYNRWGTVVFKTNNPDINWDGNNQNNNTPCSDGTYFYVCQVNTLRLDGIESQTIKGFVQLFREK